MQRSGIRGSFVAKPRPSCQSTTPVSEQRSEPCVKMDRRGRPVHDAIHQSVVERVALNVIDAPCENGAGRRRWPDRQGRERLQPVRADGSGPCSTHLARARRGSWSGSAAPSRRPRPVVQPVRLAADVRRNRRRSLPPLSYPLARRRTEQCHYSIQNPRGGSRELTSLGQDQLLVGRKQLAGASIALHS
jgi:hypothetical protein